MYILYIVKSIYITLCKVYTFLRKPAAYFTLKCCKSYANELHILHKKALRKFKQQHHNQ